MGVAGYRIRTDGVNITDVGLQLPAMVPGLAAGWHTAEIARYDEFANLIYDKYGSPWGPIIRYLVVDTINFGIDAGRTTGGTIALFEQDQYFNTDSIAVGPITAPDLTGVPAWLQNPLVWQYFRAYNIDRPIQTIPATRKLVGGKPYLYTWMGVETNVSHVIGNGMIGVRSNGAYALAIGEQYPNCEPFFDVSEMAGGTLKAMIRQYIVTPKNDGTLVITTDTCLGNLSSDIRTFGSFISEAPPQSAFSVKLPVDQTGYVVITDESTGDPTSWFTDLGDGNTSTLQNPQHQYASAGQYTVTQIVTNAYGTTTSSQTITITSKVTLTPPTSALTGTRGLPFSQSVLATGGVGAMSASLVPVLPNELVYTQGGVGWRAGTYYYQWQKKGFPSGFSVVNGNVVANVADDGKGPILVVLMGDSTMASYMGAYSPNDPPYGALWTTAAELARLLPLGSTVVSLGVAGSSIEENDTNFNSVVLPYLSGDYEKMVVIFGAGTNNVQGAAGSANPATMLAGTTSIAGKVHATGALFVSRKIPMSANWTVGNGLKAIADTYNNGLGAIANTATVADLLQNPTLANTAHNRYWFGGAGAVHMTELSYPIQGREFYKIVDALPNTGAGSKASVFYQSVKNFDAAGNALITPLTLTINP